MTGVQTCALPISVFGSIIGYSAYSYALRHLPSAVVSLYAYANPVFAVVLGALILGEPLGARVAVSAALVLCGSAVVQARQLSVLAASVGRGLRRALVPALLLAMASGSASAQQAAPASQPSLARATFRFFAGGAAGLALHESGHLVTALATGTTPGIEGVRGGGIPFSRLPTAPSRHPRSS